MSVFSPQKETRHFWAFAIDTTQRQRKTRHHQPAPRRSLDRYAIMSCSPSARKLGVQTGMRLHEARKIAPDLRVIVCNR